MQTYGYTVIADVLDMAPSVILTATGGIFNDVTDCRIYFSGFLPVLLDPCDKAVYFLHVTFGYPVPGIVKAAKLCNFSML